MNWLRKVSYSFTSWVWLKRSSFFLWLYESFQFGVCKSFNKSGMFNVFALVYLVRYFNFNRNVHYFYFAFTMSLCVFKFFILCYWLLSCVISNFFDRRAVNNKNFKSFRFFNICKFLCSFECKEVGTIMFIHHDVIIFL